MALTVVRYHGATSEPRIEIEVDSPQAAVHLLRSWHREYPLDAGMVLDDQRQPIATSRPLPSVTQAALPA